ncbi:MAG: hypothetical protein ACTSVV_15410 [Promethearchaeota archaeon]
MSKHDVFSVYDVEESGDLNEINIEPSELQFYLDPEKVLIIVSEEVRRIYLWKGAKSSVKKRFLGSRKASEIQGELMKNGHHRCKILSIDQGDELEEFLNQFGLESMEVKEKLEDMRYIRNKEREEQKIKELLETKKVFEEPSKLEEINKMLDKDEKILWIKSSKMKVSKNWAKNLMRDKRYKDRLKNIAKAKDIEEKEYENRYVVTNKRILVNSKLNLLYDFSGIPERIFGQEGDIAYIMLEGLDSFEIEKNKTNYYVWINSEPIKKGAGVFLFEGLTQEELDKLLDVFAVVFPYRPHIEKNIKIKFEKRD